MSRRRKHAAHANHERWLVSYADFITLLFAFFVVLYASSQVDKAKMGKLAAAIEGAFQQMGVFNGASIGPPIDINEVVPNSDEGEGNPGNRSGGPDGSRKRNIAATRVKPSLEAEKGGTTPDVLALKRELESALASEIDRREVALRIGPEGLVVSLREIGFFDSGSAVLKPGSEAAIGRIAILLRERRSAVRVEGHTDNFPIHTPRFNSNWELSTARATGLLKLLIDKYTFPPNQLSAAGYGEFHALANNSSEDGRRQNRRVDLVILAAPGRHLARESGTNIGQGAVTSNGGN